MRWGKLKYKVLLSISVMVLLMNLIVVPAFADDAGYALHFDGTSDFVELPRTNTILASGWESTKTVSLWVRPDGIQSECTVEIDLNTVAECDSIFGDFPTWWGIAIGRLAGPNQDRIWVWNYDGSIGSPADIIGVSYTPNEWVHISLVHNNGMLRAYKNGNEVGSKPSGPTQQPPGNDTVLSLGGVIVSSTDFWLFKGDIDEVSIWNRALSASEISANIYQDMPTNTTGLAAFYRMSNGSGSSLTDDSGNGHTGILRDGARGVLPDGRPPQWVDSDAFFCNGPSVTINQTIGQADPTTASPINFTVIFSEPVTGFVTGDVSLSGAAGATTAVVTGSGTTYHVAVSGMTNAGTVIASIDGGVAYDFLGEPNKPSTSTDNIVTFQIVAAGPTVMINQAGSQADPTGASPINFTVTFCRPVTGFTAGDVSLSGTTGATTTVVTGSGAVYNVAVSGMVRSGTVIADIPPGVARDASGLPNAASTSTDNIVNFLDTTRPTVTIDQAIGQLDPAPEQPVHFLVVFSEPVEDFSTSDVSFAASTAPGPLIVAVNGSGTTYDVAISGMTGDGIVQANILAGVVHDASGNANTVSTSTDNAITFKFFTVHVYLPLIQKP